MKERNRAIDSPLITYTTHGCTLPPEGALAAPSSSIAMTESGTAVSRKARMLLRRSTASLTSMAPETSSPHGGCSARATALTSLHDGLRFAMRSKFGCRQRPDCGPCHGGDSTRPCRPGSTRRPGSERGIAAADHADRGLDHPRRRARAQLPRRAATPTHRSGAHVRLRRLVRQRRASRRRGDLGLS